MLLHIQTGLFLAIHIAMSLGVPTPSNVSTVILDHATFVGVSDGVANKFLGIPFAKPPCVTPFVNYVLAAVVFIVYHSTGDRRFRFPVPNDPYTGTHQAVAFGDGCPQQSSELTLPSALASESVDFIENTIMQLVTPNSEDCEFTT